MPPNVLYLHSHDTGKFIQPYGHTCVTPNLERFASQGVLFRNAFCAAPTCSPSRAALLTGEYPHNTGMLGLAHRGWKLNDYTHHLARTLRTAGYQSVLAGVQHIFDWNSKVPAWKAIGYDRELPTTDEDRADVAAQFLRSSPKQPFFLDIGFNLTHRPFPAPASDDPTTDPRRAIPPAFLPDDLPTRQDMAAFNTAVRQLDEQYGKILRALDDAQLADNTLVICTTDHGIPFPFAKCNLTDAGIGVMLIIRGPGAFTGGKTIDAMVSHLDIFPTLCDLLAIPRPSWLVGESLLPLVDGSADSIHDELFAEVTFHAAYEPQRSVRTSRYKYIRRFDDRTRPVLPNCDDGPSKIALLESGFADAPRPQEMLFDLESDPHEQRNLIADDAMQAVASDLRNRLTRWMRKTNDPLLNGPVPPPSGAILNSPDALSWQEPPFTVP